ncbi:hypothetical protein PVAG01_11404 [Phlyctema vagabunda]|uniref:C2H2-type domain-containing protein n=1 Tax=Phlyctema vagabunda TaxID=108571 RepID=A0ABR4P270_9HELO
MTDQDQDRRKSPETLGLIETKTTKDDVKEHHLEPSTEASPDLNHLLNLAANKKRVPRHPATFQCSLCPKRFTRAYNLRSHLRTHTDERPFICNICGKAFARQHDRKRHEGLHSGEKRFVCKGELQSGGSWGCGRRFARIDALARHFLSEAGQICIMPLYDNDRDVTLLTSHDRGNRELLLNPRGVFPATLLLQYPALGSMAWATRSDVHLTSSKDPSHDITERSFSDASDRRNDESGRGTEHFESNRAFSPAPSFASIDTFHDSGMGTSAASSKGPGSTTPTEISYIAKQEILLSLGGSDALRFLFEEAVTRFDRDRFIRNVQRILLLYSNDLASEPQSGRNADALRILRKDSEWLASRLHESADPNHVLLNTDMDAILEQNVDKLPILENFFKTTLPHLAGHSFEPISAEARYESDIATEWPTENHDTESIISDFPEDIDADIDYSKFPSLEQIKAFLLDGQAFVLLEQRLASFVYPKPGPKVQENLAGPSLDHATEIPKEIASEESLYVRQGLLSEGSGSHISSTQHLQKQGDLESLDGYNSTSHSSSPATELYGDYMDNFDSLLADESDSDEELTTTIEKRFTHPYGHLQKLADIQERVFETSGLLYICAHHGVPPTTTSGDGSFKIHLPPPTGFPDLYQRQKYEKFLPSLDYKIIHRLLTSLSLLTRLGQNVTYLQSIGYGDGNISILAQVDNRQNVVELQRLGSGKILQLSRIATNSVSILEAFVGNDEWFSLLVATCQSIMKIFGSKFELLEKQWRPPSEEAIAFIYCTSLFLSMGVVSYASAHVVRDGPNSSGPTRFDFTGIDMGLSMNCRRRRLRCMDDFLGGNEVWVFSCQNYALDDGRLLLSTEPHVLADIWGPLWEVKTPSGSVLRYSIGNGVIIPWVEPNYAPSPGDSMTINEEFQIGYYRHTEGSKEIGLNLIRCRQNGCDAGFALIDELHDHYREKHFTYTFLGSDYLYSCVGCHATLPPQADPRDVPCIDCGLKGFEIWLTDIVESPTEIFCHWMHSKGIDEELIKAHQSNTNKVFEPGCRLLIGAIPGLTGNSKCQPTIHEFLQVKSKLETEHAIGIPGATSSRRFADSHGVTAQASIFSLVNVGGTITYKRQSGTTMRDDLIAKWQDSKLRNLEELECNGGLLVSICTRNSMRATIRDILHTRTMKLYLESIAFTWVSRECKTAYFTSLKKRKTFRTFWFSDARWRENAGDAIYLCLRRLECTGVDVDNRELNVLWVESFGQAESDDDSTDSDSDGNVSVNPVPPPTEELLVRLFRSEFGWSGLVANSMDCLTMAVMTTVCLEYDRGRRCRGITTFKRKSEPILQTKLCINERLMREKRIAPEINKLACHGIWKRGSFEEGEKLYLGGHGNVKILNTLSNCLCHHSSLEVEWHPVLSETALELKDVAKNEIIMGKGVEMHHWEYMKGVSLYIPLRLLVLPR